MITTLHGTQVTESAGWLVHRTQVEFAPGTLTPGEVSFSVAPGDVAVADPSPIPLVPAALVLACRLSQDLRVDHPLPPAMHRGAQQVAALLHRWYGWRPAELIAPIGSEPVRPHWLRRSRRRGVGLYFTRGVDSWGTLLDLLDGPVRHRPTHLITVDNEVHLDPALRDQLIADTATVAQQLGLPLITVKTDIRTLLDPHTDWGTDTHGSVLAGIGLLLRRALGEVVISPTHWTPLLRPWGSHPDLDPAWSLPELDVIHHPGDIPRWRRVGQLVQDPIAIESLLVCWQGSSRRNCGRCEKCLRLMTSLELLGATDQTAGRFDAPFDPAAIGDHLTCSPHPWCDTIDHLDHVGLRADALRQRWEQVPRVGRPAMTFQSRPCQPRLPVDASAADPTAVEALARHLATLGLRVDREATPRATDPALVLANTSNGLAATVRTADGGGPSQPLEQLCVDQLRPLIGSIDGRLGDLVPFDPDGQGPPRTVTQTTR